MFFAQTVKSCTVTLTLLTDDAFLSAQRKVAKESSTTNYALAANGPFGRKWNKWPFLSEPGFGRFMGLVGCWVGAA